MLRKLSNRKWGLAVAGLVIVNLLLFGWGYRRSAYTAAGGAAAPTPPPSSCAPEPSAVPMGAVQVEPPKVDHASAYGSKVQALPEQVSAHLKAEWRLLLMPIFNAGSPDPKLQYMEVLHRKYGGQGLKVLGVYNGTAAQADAARHKFGLSFPLVSDAGRELQGRLQIDTGRYNGGVVLVDSDSRLKFADSEIPREDELRMLLEKNLNGKVDYSYYETRPETLFREGGSLPSLELELLSSGEVDSFGGRELAGKRLVIFLADCASCQVESYVKQFAALGKRQPDSKADSIAVFTTNFAGPDLNLLVSKYGLGSSVYVLRSDVPELFSEYVTRYRSKAGGPLLISIDREGLVESVGPFPEEGE